MYVFLVKQLMSFICYLRMFVHDMYNMETPIEFYHSAKLVVCFLA